MATQVTQAPIPKDEYLSFDAYTMKQHIRDMLNESGTFTDQNFEGSYLSTINNVVSYTFNSLMYYLNKTSSESMFSEAQIYENINRIVKMLSYKPIGFQTATLPFSPTVGSLTPGVYLIPKYSYFIANEISYSFNEDIIFEKSIEGAEALTDIANSELLFQGRFREYAIQTATGEDNEIINLTTPDSVSVDHFNIQVYVYRNLDDRWEQWSQTENLYLEPATASKFESRLNENKQYEIKFGNDINGAKLNTNDRVAIYYIESSGVNGEIGPGFLNNSSFVIFNSSQISEIMRDVRTTTASTLPNSNLFTAVNTFPSSNAKNIESPDDIRANAPGIYRSQLRLVTRDDYRNFILTNFGNYVHDTSIANNWQFLSGRMKYLYDLGLENPMTDTPTLYAHSLFADSCNFNNIYVTACPKTSVTTTNNTPVLSNSQKQSIVSTINPRKTLTSEIVMLDPIYMGVDIALNKDNANITTADIDLSSLYIVKQTNARRSDQDIKQDIVEIFTSEFAQANQTLGNKINITDITNQILSVEGVSKIYTKRTDTGEVSEGLTLVVFNPIYPQDVSIVNNNTDLLDFQFAYLSNSEDLFARIEIESQVKIYENIEY